ncbi:hypothetical protein GA0115233_11103 [Streptomyces sp. DI166]|uniref:hypothetical protein n=1 Tax=Streptomyces sp. DI166 TaxID=1839783 RepID=UPI0007F47977|nr:hypothetical protein [Streptomyces sp. DI166]SBT94938.1 hypothetical protein GA0115233_11103 [Streptomyces sp. DI166]
MSLTSGIHCPRTPLRRFLDRELSAGAHPLRKNFRARDHSSHILMPGPGVGTEAGNVGTAIDYRLRLAFTAAEPVDHVARAGILLISPYDSDARQRMRNVGDELAERLKETVLRLQLDNRELPMDRALDDEEDLARMLIAAAWYQVNYRTSIGFAFTPLAITAREDPSAFTLERLLQLPHRDMVADVVGQLYKAADGPLNDLRARTRPEDCTPAPTFPTDRIAADADLAIDGLLLDFKSTRYTRTLRQAEAWQLTGYLLLDTDDRYRVDTVGLYLSRSGTLASWPVEEYLELLGACRRDVLAFRTAFTELLEGCTADVEPYDQEEEDRVRKLLQRLAPVADQGHCLVCTQPCPTSGRRPREFCSSWCRGRAQFLRNRGLLPGGPNMLLPRPRKQLLDVPEDAEIVSLTPHSRR